jgi:pimeloyl-ACP methyl ester carboxylesterase
MSCPKKLKEKFLNHKNHKILQNVGHNVPQENPDEFANAILELLS